MKISEAYRPQTLIGRSKELEADLSLQVMDDFNDFKKFYGKDKYLAQTYLDRIERSLKLYEKQIKNVDTFYKEFRLRLEDALDVETSLNRKQYGTEAGLMQAKNMLDLFFYENKFQTDLKSKKDRLVSFSNIRENLEILRKNAKEDIVARIDIILGLLGDFLYDTVPEPDTCFSEADNVADSALRDEYESGFIPSPLEDEAHNEEEIITSTKIMSTTIFKPQTMVHDVLYILTDGGDNLYADVKFVHELPKDFRDNDLYRDTLFVIVDDNINEDNDKIIVQTDEPTDESESGFYIVREKDPSENVKEA